MATTIEAPAHEPHAPVLGQEGEACAACAAPLATDQRYCLNCGRRRAEARIAFLDLLGDAERESRAVDRVHTTERELAPAGGLPMPIAVGIAVALVILLLSFGVVLGTLVGGPRGTSGPATPEAAGDQPAVAFASDWPRGKQGFTVQLRALKKDGTDPAGVAQAKQEAVDAGAPAVGALDSDNHPSLDPGNYVIYSGVYATAKDARKRLAQLKARFPQATVVRVGSRATGPQAAAGGKISNEELTAGKEAATVGRDQLGAIERASGNSRESAKLPKTIGIEGKPPPKDDKAAGGSDPGAATEIGP